MKNLSVILSGSVILILSVILVFTATVLIRPITGIPRNAYPIAQSTAIHITDNLLLFIGEQSIADSISSFTNQLEGNTAYSTALKVSSSSLGSKKIIALKSTCTAFGDTLSRFLSTMEGVDYWVWVPFDDDQISRVQIRWIDTGIDNFGNRRGSQTEADEIQRQFAVRILTPLESGTVLHFRKDVLSICIEYILFHSPAYVWEYIHNRATFEPVDLATRYLEYLGNKSHRLTQIEISEPRNPLPWVLLSLIFAFAVALIIGWIIYGLRHHQRDITEVINKHGTAIETQISNIQEEFTDQQRLTESKLTSIQSGLDEKFASLKSSITSFQRLPDSIDKLDKKLDRIEQSTEFIIDYLTKHLETPKNSTNLDGYRPNPQQSSDGVGTSPGTKSRGGLTIEQLTKHYNTILTGNKRDEYNDFITHLSTAGVSFSCVNHSGNPTVDPYEEVDFYAVSIGRSHDYLLVQLDSQYYLFIAPSFWYLNGDKFPSVRLLFATNDTSGDRRQITLLRKPALLVPKGDLGYKLIQIGEIEVG